ncbi:hypothetical protein NL533_32835, partial [Klebsiella pneumoniae]|nr:hypothetical protein [Klebsiella pneumoniae]
FVFRGGTTLIYDLETARLRYSIRKNILGAARLARQRDFQRRPDIASLRASLGGAAALRAGPFALLHQLRLGAPACADRA